MGIAKDIAHDVPRSLDTGSRHAGEPQEWCGQHGHGLERRHDERHEDLGPPPADGPRDQLSHDQDHGAGERQCDDQSDVSRGLAAEDGAGEHGRGREADAGGEQQLVGP